MLLYNNFLLSPDEDHGYPEETWNEEMVKNKDNLWRFVEEYLDL